MLATNDSFGVWMLVEGKLECLLYQQNNNMTTNINYGIKKVFLNTFYFGGLYIYVEDWEITSQKCE